MSRTLTLRNRHRAHPVDLRLFRRLMQALLTDLCRLDQYDLGVCLMNERQMTQLNESYLQHAGSTDVITFDYAPVPANQSSILHGEIYICLDEAVVQARRFRTSWQSELARYAVHSVLHLLGYDDLRTVPRRQMKQRENLCLRLLARQFDLRRLCPGQP